MDLAVAFLGFLVLHAVVARWAKQSFTRNLKLSRGLAGLVLVTTGLLALVRWWPLWPQAFLTVHSSRADGWPVAILLGHLLADLVWFIGGRLLLDSKTKRDLVLHHLLGAIACAVALGVRAGYGLLGVVLLTEMLPVLTGLGAWARMHRHQALEHRVLKASLATVVGLRIPIWLLLGVTFTATLLSGDAPAIHWTVAPVFYPALVFIIVLDLYWRRAYLGLLAAFPRRGIRDVSIDPLAPLLAGANED